MARSTDNPLPKAITDAAARWLAAAEGDGLSADESAALDAWLHADARHLRAFAEMQDLWAHMGAVPDTPALRASLASPRLQRWRTRPTTKAPHRRRWIVPALAASLALVFIGYAEDLPVRLEADEMTATGERRTVKLPDGSSIQLDTQSAVAFDFGHGRRVVRLLSGTAAFTVARDPARPFTVEAGDGSATALGTRFLVRTDADGASVTVTQHKVRVAYPAPQGPATIVAEGQGVAYGGGRLGRVTPANTADAMAWTEGVLVVKDRPLSEVVAEIGRYHPGYVRVLGDAQTLRVSGVFHIDAPIVALGQLQRSLGLRSTRLTDRFILIFA